MGVVILVVVAVAAVAGDVGLVTDGAIARRTLLEVLLLGGVCGLGTALVLAELLTRAIGRPLQTMTETADALGRGDFSKRIRSRRGDVLRALGAAIDRMADQLVERVEGSRREEARLRTILNGMVEGVLVTDPQGRIVATNPALDAMVTGEVLGRTPVEVIRSAELHDAVSRGLRGERCEVTFGALVRGESRTLVTQISPLPRGGAAAGGVVAVLHDITTLKRADAVRRDFVANASHELRTPLTAIRGFAETLQDGALDHPAMAKRFVGSIADNAIRLQALVEDLLALSRAESPDAGFERRPLDVVEAAAGVVRGLEQRASERGQTLAMVGGESPVHALADGQALDQILVNLVDNAIKYGAADGRIEVRIRVAPTARGADRVVVEVADDGPGIPRRHLDRIFERFYRVDEGRARERGGTGLGLSIVRHLVERLGGRIEVESRVGRGTTFRVALVAAAMDVETAAPVNAAAQ
jgi:two-component system phosphate regulon sensor histidine kinase PhoR